MPNCKRTVDKSGGLSGEPKLNLYYVCNMKYKNKADHGRIRIFSSAK